MTTVNLYQLLCLTVNNLSIEILFIGICGRRYNSRRNADMDDQMRIFFQLFSHSHPIRTGSEEALKPLKILDF